MNQDPFQYTRFDQCTLDTGHWVFDAIPEMGPDRVRGGFALRPLPGGAGCADVRAGFGGG